MFNRQKKDGRSFLEKLTGVTGDEMPEFTPNRYNQPGSGPLVRRPIPEPREMLVEMDDEDEEEDMDGELAVDVYETANDFIIHTMTAGVRPEDLTISITPEVVKISGKRESARDFSNEDVIHKELYWGSFSRTINLPKEIEPDAAEAVEKHGLLIIRLPKVDKLKTHRVKVKSV